MIVRWFWMNLWIVSVVVGALRHALEDVIVKDAVCGPEDAVERQGPRVYVVALCRTHSSITSPLVAMGV